MKYHRTSALLLLLTFSSSFAFPGLMVIEPDQTRTAAKYAKHKARISANNLYITEDDIANNTDGCDLNIGNLSLDQGVTNVPNEMIVIIEGDIIQANECQSF